MSDFRWYVYQADCLEVLQRAPADYFDSVVSDPPGGIGFMNREWDSDKGGRSQWVGWMTQVMKECFRVVKPGSHILIWAIPRTSHWTATAIEDAGFEIRDICHHIQGQGFPKSQNVSKVMVDSGAICACTIDQDGWKETTSRPNLSDVSNGVPPQEPEGEGASEVLLPSVLRPVAVEGPEGTNPHDLHSSERPRQETSRQGLSYGKEPCLEGRSDLQAQQGELRRAEVCSVLLRMAPNGAKGRLCDGASVSDGAVGRLLPDANRGSSSHRPQHAEQRTGKSGVVAQQSGTQGGGRWPLCPRCGKPILSEGLGTALKPSTEHWILARKPLSEPSIARNVLMHGTGVLNIDGCRVERASDDVPGWHKTGSYGRTDGFLGTDTFKIRDMPPEEVQARCGDKGRWPTNLLLSHDETCGFEDGECAPGCPVAELDRQSGITRSGRSKQKHPGYEGESTTGFLRGVSSPDNQYADSGGASRFFPTFRYQAKPSRAEKEAGLESLEWISVEIKWDNEVRKVRLLMDTAQSPPKVTVASTGADVSEWNMMLFGNNTMVPSLLGWKCIIETRTNSTIESATLRWLTNSLTSASTPAVNSDMESGGNHAVGVESLILQSDTIDAKTASLLGVENVVVSTQVTIRSGGGTLQRMNPGGLSNDPRWAPVEAKCTHPTVKGVKLMRWLCRLITPKNGCVLDPFAGSGSTGVACMQEGFRFVGIEQDGHFCEIARARISAAEAEEENDGRRTE